MNKKLLIFLSLAAVLTAVVLTPLASSAPDGLERVAVDYGFLKNTDQPNHQPLAGYNFPGLANRAASTSAAGATGTILAFGGMYLLGRLLRRGSKSGE